ncbi:hypothetical protein ACFV1W_29495 [Kitasatospora sp. NPDC059648]|uniref:hypothetical protein n=1 Tax=Kitasatospora sp. NPDC059648 TaxID=3346894 RepID=UPI0036CABE6B
MTAYFTLVCDDIPHNVVLLDAGSSPLEVAKTFREVTGGGLWHAKQTVTDTPPVLLFEGIEERAARSRCHGRGGAMGQRECPAVAHSARAGYFAPEWDHARSGDHFEDPRSDEQPAQP